MDFLIHWPPGPVVATVQCQGLVSTTVIIASCLGSTTSNRVINEVHYIQYFSLLQESKDTSGHLILVFFSLPELKQISDLSILLPDQLFGTHSLIKAEAERKSTPK